MFTEGDGSFVARAQRDEAWRIERSGRRVRVLGPGATSRWVEGPLYAKPMGAALLSVGGKPYRGDLALFASDTGVMAQASGWTTLVAS